jgi:uncharacterized protein (DUF924 family)
MSPIHQPSSSTFVDRAQAILNFWFGAPSEPSSDYGQQRQVWFKKDPDFDAAVRQRFQADYENARAGQLNSWIEHPRHNLALILLLDQVPRNIFRGSPQSFATDPQALEAAKYGISHQLDQWLIPVERLFMYLPFEHSEDLADQNTSIQLFQHLVEANPELQTTLDYAERHREVIQRFSRFPHRNEILQRDTTPAEAEFLKQPGSRF